VTTDIADRAGAFGQRFGGSHGLSPIDAIVAAAAEFLSADLATLNLRHFPMFPGLKRPY
jgi:predicted nucleic acid-binding protein